MYKILDSFLLYWRILISKKLNILLIFISFIYNIYLFYNFLFPSFEPGQALVKSSFIVQGGILVSIMLSIYLANMEKTIRFNEVLSTIQGANLYKTLGKISFFLSLINIYLFVNILILMIMFQVTDIPFSNFYLNSTLYFILYWGLSFTIGGLIGILLSFWIKGRVIYILSMIIWLLISPLNYPFIIQLGIFLKLPNTFEIINFLNIGQNNPHYPYQPFYGFALEDYQWFKRLFFIVSLLLAIILSLIIKGNHKLLNTVALISLTIVFGLLINEIQEKRQILHFDREADAILKKDSMFYENTQLEMKQENFKITSYSIEVDYENFLKAEVLVDIKNTSDKNQKEINFLLYHDLKINKLTDENGLPLKYSQNKDSVKIITKKEIPPGKNLKINFHYEGLSSPFFFANKQAMNLLNHYPWLPTISKYNTIMYNHGYQTFRLPLQPNHDITYTLVLKNKNKIYTNLEKVSKNKWRGTTNHGIYIVTGSLNERIINHKSVVYPLTWDRLLTNFNPFSQRVEETLQKINKELNINRNVKVERYMFIDQSINTDYPEQHIWIHGKTVAISPNTYFFNDYNGLKMNNGYLTYGLVPAITWKNEGVFREDLKELRLFDYSYAYFLNIRSEFEDEYKSSEYFDYYIQDLEVQQDKKSFELAQSIQKYLNNENIPDEHKIKFFKNWYEKLRKGNGLFDIENFMNKY